MSKIWWGAVRKGPSSGHPGRVREQDVWDSVQEVRANQQSVQHLIQDALTLSVRHTLDTLINHLAQPNEIRRTAITPGLRARVVQSIEAVDLQEKTRQSLLGLLDKRPDFLYKQNPRQKFEWWIDAFITVWEKKAILDFIVAIEGCGPSYIQFMNPQRKLGKKFLQFILRWSRGKKEIEFYYPEADKLSIALGRTKQIFDISANETT